MKVNEAEIFSRNQCDFSTNRRGNLNKHALAKHIGDAMIRRNKFADECDLKIVHIKKK